MAGGGEMILRRLSGLLVGYLVHPLFWLQGERVVETVRTPLQRLWVTKTITGGRINLRTGILDIQTAMSTRDPAEPLFFPYRVAAAALGLVRQPGRFLVLGLGGGTILHIIHRAYPEAAITAVDIDPAMPGLARRHFAIPPAEFHPADAADYMRRHAGCFDAVFLDAFRGTRTPASMRTRAFFRDVARHLAPGGVVYMNTARRHLLDTAHRGTVDAFREVFPYTAVISRFPPVAPANVILLGAVQPPLVGEGFAERLRELVGSGRLSARALQAARLCRWRHRSFFGDFPVDGREG